MNEEQIIESINKLVDFYKAEMEKYQDLYYKEKEKYELLLFHSSNNNCDDMIYMGYKLKDLISYKKQLDELLKNNK